jgi:hypothetical protein
MKYRLWLRRREVVGTYGQETRIVGGGSLLALGIFLKASQSGCVGMFEVNVEAAGDMVDKSRTGVAKDQVPLIPPNNCWECALANIEAVDG